MDGSLGFCYVLAFDPTSWYAYLLAAAGIYLFWREVVSKGHSDAKAIRKCLRREPPEPAPHPRSPEVVLGHPSAGISLTPANERTADGKRQLVKVDPTFLIENKGTTSIREVDAGVRTRDGLEHRFTAFHAPLIAPGESATATGGTIPPEWLADVHESVAQNAFRYWARFEDADGHLWEAIYDAEHRLHEYAFLRSAGSESR